MTKKFKDTSITNIIVKTIILVVLLLFAISYIAILVWGFLTTLKSKASFEFDGNVFGFPSILEPEFYQLKNYKIMLENLDLVVKDSFYNAGKLVSVNIRVPFYMSIYNSIVYALGTAVLSTFVTCIVAYVCSKFKNYVFSSIIYMVNLFVMVTPIVGSSGVLMELLRKFGLYDTLTGIIIPGITFTGMYFLVFYAMLSDLPNSYSEAAEIDGAGRLRIMFSIIIPLVSKTISTVILLKFIATWQDYNTALLFLPSHPTVAYVIWYYTVGGGRSIKPELGSVPIQISSCMILALPIIVLFIFARDKIMGNVSIGGIKE